RCRFARFEFSLHARCTFGKTGRANYLEITILPPWQSGSGCERQARRMFLHSVRFSVRCSTNIAITSIFISSTFRIPGILADFTNGPLLFTITLVVRQEKSYFGLL